MSSYELDALLDRVEVLEVLGHFSCKVDEYDTARLGDVFTHDCSTDQGPAREVPVEGRAAVVARISSGQAESQRTRHQLGQRVASESGEADARTYGTATYADSKCQCSKAHLRYIDRFRRTDIGWRMARGEVIDDVPLGHWNFVVRREDL